MCVIFALELTPQPPVLVPGLRPVVEADRDALRELFVDAFRAAPEYANYPDDTYAANADRYLDEFFAGKRGRWSPASRLIEADGRTVAAATVKLGSRRPYVDCVMVRPTHFRRGLATLVTRGSLAALAAEEYGHVRSAAMLANTDSQAWHRAFGFVEVPCRMVAESRWRNAGCELERLRKIGEFSPDEEPRHAAEVERLLSEFERLEQQREVEFGRSYPTLGD